MSRCPSCDYPLPATENVLVRAVRTVVIRFMSRRDALAGQPAKAKAAAPSIQALRRSASVPAAATICARCAARSGAVRIFVAPVCSAPGNQGSLAGNRTAEFRSGDAERWSGRRRVGGDGAGLVPCRTAFRRRRRGQVVGVLAMFAGSRWAAVLSVFGVGNAAAVLRMRGGSMILAVVGLLLCCLDLGILIGIFVMTIWQS